MNSCPPSFIHIYVGSAKTGTGAPEGNRVGGLGMWIMNAMTPETPVSTNYYWGVARDFQVHWPETTRLIFNEITTAFEEDKQILEAQIDRIVRQTVERQHARGCGRDPGSPAAANAD
ncbi:hypothetical protein [Bradyrhizobium sp. CB1015]|uniref:hypothetical protein n=1 Tax=Bradyrhizobium sp. CB1015 TaxID=2976822 RepID=UPI0021A9B4DD|nr:hypothetical protein [Bradyrhizobium sp. CB1015]UWU91017.1 hypothetical protein N2604_31945 [Bradyrhizobium sp. CB1015]